MAETLRVRKVGNSFGVLLPQPLIEALQARESDELYLVETPDGMKPGAYEPAFAAVVEDAKAFMRTHRNAFRELAK